MKPLMTTFNSLRTYCAIGHGDTKGKTHPKLVSALEGKYVVAAAIGDGFMVASTSTSELYGWVWAQFFVAPVAHFQQLSCLSSS